jgi:hypothetical protein
LEVPLVDNLCLLDKPVRQCGLAVIDVCYDAKVADVLIFCHWGNYNGKGQKRQGEQAFALGNSPGNYVPCGRG